MPPAPAPASAAGVLGLEAAITSSIRSIIHAAAAALITCSLTARGS